VTITITNSARTTRRGPMLMLYHVRKKRADRCRAGLRGNELDVDGNL